MTVNRRVRVADALRRRTGLTISRMDLADIEKEQNRSTPHNWLTDRIFGRVADGVTVRNSSFAARSGAVGLRTYAPHGRAPRGTVINFHGGPWTCC